MEGKEGDEQREVTTVHFAVKPGLSPKPALLPLPLDCKTIFLLNKKMKQNKQINKSSSLPLDSDDRNILPKDVEQS